MKMRMILPAGNSGASSNNGGGNQMNGNQMNGMPQNTMPQSTMPMQHPMPQSMPHMPMPHAGASPHAMPHHDPSGGGYQNNMGAMNAGMMAGGYGARGASNMEMGMASVMPLPMGNGGQMAAQARAMGFTTNPEDYDGYGAESYEAEARRRRSRRTGRFIRGAAEEGYDMEARGAGMRGLEMKGSSWDDDDDEDMGYASSKPGGSDKALKKKIKMLEKKVEALQEALEEQDEAPGKKSKKKKPKPEPDDEDDEEDGATASAEENGPDLSKMLAEAVSSKDFLKQLPTILMAVVEVIKNPPPTWPPYIAKNDLSGIFTMEARELMKAVEQYKAGQKPAQDVCKEMKHAGAALIQMYATLLQTINPEQSE